MKAIVAAMLVLCVILLAGCSAPTEAGFIGVLDVPSGVIHHRVYRQDFPDENIRCYFVFHVRDLGFSCLPLEGE